MVYHSSGAIYGIQYAGLDFRRDFGAVLGNYLHVYGNSWKYGQIGGIEMKGWE